MSSWLENFVGNWNLWRWPYRFISSLSFESSGLICFVPYTQVCGVYLYTCTRTVYYIIYIFVWCNQMVWTQCPKGNVRHVAIRKEIGICHVLHIWQYWSCGVYSSMALWAFFLFRYIGQYRYLFFVLRPNILNDCDTWHRSNTYV